MVENKGQHIELEIPSLTLETTRNVLIREVKPTKTDIRTERHLHLEENIVDYTTGNVFVPSPVTIPQESTGLSDLSFGFEKELSDQFNFNKHDTAYQQPMADNREAVIIGDYQPTFSYPDFISKVTQSIQRTNATRSVLMQHRCFFNLSMSEMASPASSQILSGKEVRSELSPEPLPY